MGVQWLRSKIQQVRQGPKSHEQEVPCQIRSVQEEQTQLPQVGQVRHQIQQILHCCPETLQIILEKAQGMEESSQTPTPTQEESSQTPTQTPTQEEDSQTPTPYTPTQTPTPTTPTPPSYYPPHPSPWPRHPHPSPPLPPQGTVN